MGAGSPNKRLFASIGTLVVSAGLAFIAWYLVLDPNAGLDDFPGIEVALKSKEIVRKKPGASDYFELWLAAEGGERFYLREPDDANLRAYHAAIPLEVRLSVHYTDSSDGKRLVDLRDATDVYVPLATVLAEERNKRDIISVFAALLFCLGAIGLTLHWRQRKRSTAG